MSIFTKIGRFVLLSSADPQKTSASLKFALLGAIPYIMHATGMVCELGYTCTTIDPNILEQIATVTADLIFSLLTLISLVGTAFGLVRKLYRTATGQNRAIM